jgi:5-methylcytosine-specific restriction enzyme subunit McrC
MRCVTLFEFQKVLITESPNPDSIYVTPSEADSIQQAAVYYGCKRPREWFSIVRISNKSYLKAGCWVGVISAGNLRLEVLPKIGSDDEGLADQIPKTAAGERIDLLKMLTETGELPDCIIREVVGGHSMNDIVEFTIRWYITKLNSLINLGLVRGYQESVEDLGVLRGRINPKAQMLNRFLRKPLIACIYDDFTEDTKLNRILKAGLRCCIMLSQNLNQIAIARSSLTLMDTVSNQKVSSKEARAYVLERREQKFESLHSLACFFLENETPDLINPINRESDNINKNKTVGILYNMELLFEKYVYTKLNESRGRYSVKPHVVTAQEKSKRFVVRKQKLNSPSELIFALKPDIVIRDKNEKTLMVADTKWKTVKINNSLSTDDSSEQVAKVGKRLGISQSDIYQLLAYSEYYGAEGRSTKVALIFPLDPRHDANDIKDQQPNDERLSALPSAEDESIEWYLSPPIRDSKLHARIYIKLFPLPLC